MRGKARYKNFWSHVTPVLVRRDLGECWEWQGARQSKGYRTLMIGNKRLLSHRHAWTLSGGVDDCLGLIPITEIPVGMMVCHHCDNKKCVRPSHLFIGTNTDNMRDMVKKGRERGCTSRPGSRNYNAKLTDQQVMELLLEGQFEGEPRNSYLKRLAKKYGVSRATIRCIQHGKTWKSNAVMRVTERSTG